MVVLTEEDFPLRWGDTIPDNAFEGRKDITKLYIPDRFTKIGNNAFKGCTGLTKLHLPTPWS